MTQWLIRTAQNRIDGPYPIDVVRDMITEGKLGLQDEVCASGSYWFGLHEEREVSDHFGVKVPRAKPESDQTQTETDIERTDPYIERTDPDYSRKLAEAAAEARTPSPLVAFGAYAEQAHEKRGYVSFSPHERKLSAWRSLVWVLGLAIVFVVLAVWRLLTA